MSAAAGSRSGDAEPATPRSSRRRFLVGSVAGLATGATAARALGLGSSADVASVRRLAERLDPPARVVWSSEVVGTSVEQRRIRLWSKVSSAGRFRLLVVAGVHGDERGAAAVGAAILEETLPAHVDGFVVPIANPDGWERGTRNNANDVDLNRNFPWWWKPGEGGVGPASEPETRTLMRVVETVRPHLAVWIHQPLRYVATIDPTTRTFATAWAQAAGVPVLFGISQQGGGESWTYYGAGLPSILVEAPTRQDHPGIVAAQLDGFRALVASI